MEEDNIHEDPSDYSKLIETLSNKTKENDIIPTEPVPKSQPEEKPDEVNLDEYMNRFDSVASLTTELTKIENDLVDAPHDQARVKILSKFCKKTIKIIGEMHLLLVDMNNLFSNDK
jgi:hypothetical protein